MAGEASLAVAMIDRRQRVDVAQLRRERSARQRNEIQGQDARM